MIQKLMNNMRDRYQIIVVAAIILAVLGIFLPGILLVWQSKEQMNMVDAVPVEYYSPANLAVARNASANLGIYQKLQLITGRWESNVSQADSYEREMEDYEAIEMAKEQMDALYRYGVYPTSLLSDYENWYSWEAEFCKVVDATFNTYAAYYWKLDFAKYDGSEKHSVYMLEDGTVFLAEARTESETLDSVVVKMSEKSSTLSWGEMEVVKHDLPEEGENIENFFRFSDVKTEELVWLDLSKLNVGEKEYYVLQANASNRYVFSIQPVN